MNYQRDKTALTYAMYKLWTKDNHEDEAYFYQKNLKLKEADAKNFVAFRAGVALGEKRECSGHNTILEFLASKKLDIALNDMAQKKLITLGAEKVKMTDTAEIIVKNSKDITEEIFETLYDTLLVEKFSSDEADEEEEIDEEDEDDE